MTSKISTRAAGATVPTRKAASHRNLRRARAGLLASTALVAASLAASGAMAQMAPSGGGAVVDNTGSSGGYQLTNTISLTVNNVTINNTTGSPSVHGINWNSSDFSGSGRGFTFTGTNSISSTAGSAIYYVSTGGENMGVGVLGPLTLTGLNGFVINNNGAIFHGGSGTINLIAQTNGSGSGLDWTSNNSCICDTSFTGSFSASNFQYGANLTAAAGVNFTTGAGGSITGVQTGIRAITTTGNVDLAIGSSISASGTGIDATSNGGAANVTATGAISAFNGIVATGANGATVTTSGGGTINAAINGSGTGIIATSSGGAGNVNVNVGAAIGGTNQFGSGVTASTTGGSTGVVNLTTTAAINAAFTGITLNAAQSSTAGTVSIGANVTGGTMGISAGTGRFNINVLNGATVSGSGSGFFDSGIFLNSSLHTVTNSGVILGNGTGGLSAGVYNGGGSTITNNATGVIQGRYGLYNQNAGTVTNAGSITGNVMEGYRAFGGTLNNTGAIAGATNGVLNTGNALTVNNTGGTITGATHGINNTGGFLTLVNTGTITGTTQSGVYINFSATGNQQQVTNSGSIVGGNDATNGFGVNFVDGVLTLTNQSGGTISGGTGGIRLASNNLATLNLNAGSTVTGSIVSTGSGARTTVLAGLLTGGYDASAGTGIDTFTLASTGSITGAVSLGAGEDVFNWQGGTFTTISGGTGNIDAFNSALGAGVSGSLDLGSLSNFDTYNHQSGNLTLTGTRASGAGWTLLPGTSLTLDGSLTATTGGSVGIALNGNGTPGTVSILAGATLNAYLGVNYNTGASHFFNNAGTVTATNSGVVSNGALTATNSGTITAGTDGAFSFGFSISNVTNSGTVTGGSDATAGFGVLSRYAGATVTNNAGTISGGAGGIFSGSVVGATTYGGLLSVTNAAGARITGPVAITTGGSSSLTLNNSGRVLGGANGGIVAAGSGAVSVTNNAGGQIVASGGYAIFSSGAATINNAGLIGGGTVDGGGAYTAGGNNNAIRLGAVSTVINSGTITGGSGGGIRADTSLTLINTSTGIINGLAGFGTADGVFIANGGVANVLNAGSITGTQANSAAIYSNGGGVVTNAAGGFLGTTGGYGVSFNGGTGVFNNYGTVTGDYAYLGVFGVATLNLFAGSTTGAIETGGFDDTLSVYSGRGTGGMATTDGASGIVLQNAGTLGAAVFGTANLGGGTNTLRLRGTGDGAAGNGSSGAFDLSGGSVIGASILSKLDTGTWTLTGNGAGVTTINAGDGGGNDGLLILNGTGLTAGITINGATVRAMNAAALGTGLITMINPTLQFASTGTYGNAISLAASDPINDPTNLQTFGTGITATLSGAITQATAGQPLTFSSVDANGVANAGTFVLTNTGNSWTGQTRINSGTTLSGAFNTISGGSITNNGALIYTGGAGTVGQDISGTGSFTRNGTGALLLAGTNSWTGVTTITAGELRGTTGSISGASIVNNGTLTYSNTSAGTANQNISGSGAINIMGTGVTLAGAITTTGQLTISGPGSSLILAGSRSGASNTGVILSATGGSLTVANGASLLSGQYNGVRVIGANASVTNFGLLQNAGTGGDGTVGAGVYVLNGGAGGTTTVTNGSITDTGAGSTIQGRNAGVRHESGSTDLLVVNNYGLIVGDLYNGVENTAGGLTLTNFAGGYITAVLGNGVSSNSGSAVSVTNAGVIGRNIAGTVTVNGYGVSTNGVLTLVNQSGGLITGASGGVQSNAAGSSITNQAGGTILGNYGIVTAGGTINNSGLVRGFNDAILLNGATALTNNAGGLIVGSGNEGVFVNANGSTINNAGLIVNSLSGIGANFSVGVINSGVIASGSATDAATTAAHITRNTGAAIALGAGGSVTNLAGGQILGGTGVTFSNSSTGTLTNAGLIDGSTGYGVLMTGAGTITNQAGGTIGGATGAIQLSGASPITINLQAGSTTTGQILSSGSGTRDLTVAGTLNGAYSAATGTGVDNITLASTGSMTSASLGAGNDSFQYQGGAFSGLIDGGTGVDAFTSNLGAGNVRTLSQTTINGFETFAHQSGQLTLNDVGAFTGGATVTGGTLVVDGVLTATTLVGNGATLEGTGTVNGALTIADGGILAGAQGGNLAIGSLNLSSGSIINATFTGAGGPALFAISDDLTLDGTLNVASSGAYGFGVYGLMTYGGVLTDNGLTLGTTPGGAQRVSVQTSVAGQVNVVHAPTTLLFWDGGNAGQHDNGAVNGGAGVWTAAGSEWTDANGVFNGAMEPQPGFAIFQGAGGVITVDDVAGAVGVTGMQFAADGYSVQGDSITLAAATTTIRVGNGTLAGAGWTTTIGSELTGTGQLARTDLGALILTGENTYTGGTSIDTGRLQIGAGGTTGSILGAVSLVNGGTLAFARSDNHVFSNAVSGAGTVVIDGVVTLTGPITATNGVNIGAGSVATLSDVRLVSGNAVTMSGANATVNVASGGVVQSLNGTGIFVTAANGFIVNLGAISASGTAVFANADLTLTNGASGSVSGLFAVSALQNLNLTNNGTINATITNFNNSGIYAGGTGTILNTGSITSGTNAIYTQGAGAVTNSGLIQGGGTASTIRLFGANSTVTNQAGGEITTSGSGTGVYLDGTGGTVINAGTIRGANAVNFVAAGGSLTNSGVLIGLNGSAVAANGGTVTNFAAGSVTGQLSGVTFVTAAGLVTNAGTITGNTAYGVNLNAGGAVDNSGSISGALVGVRSLAGLNLTSSGSISGSGNAVESLGAFNDSLTFLAGSTTTGSVLTDAGDDLISLAGGLTGSVGAGAGTDTVTLFHTGSFTGVLDGGDGLDSFVLDGAGSGSVDISTVVNFESRTMQGAGVFTLTGADASSAGWAINAGVLAASGGLAIGDDVTVTIGANGALALMAGETIGSLAGSGAVNLGANTLGVVNGGAYGGVIGGSGGLTVFGGVLTLSGANTYTGSTNIQGGTLAFGASDVLSDLTYVNVATGATLDLGAFTDTVGILALSGTLNGAGALTASQYQLNGATVNANLGAGVLFQLGGVTTLNGTSAATQVSINGGTLRLGASDRLADNADLYVNTGGALDIQGFSDTVRVAEIAGGVLNGSGVLTAGGYYLNGATINANLGAGSLSVQGSLGVTTLNGTSAANLVYVADADPGSGIVAGALVLGASDRLADNASVTVGTGGTLDLQGFSDTVGSLNLRGTLNGAGTLTAGSYALNDGRVNANLGTGLLFNIGGSSVLNGASAANQVSVNGGTLNLGAADRLADAATVFVASGATLNLNAFDETVGLFGLSGTLNGTGTLTAGEYQLNGATVNANLGAGNLFQVSGVSTLNGTSASEAVTIAGGTLTLGASNRLSDTATLVVGAGGSLNIGAFNETIGIAGLSGVLDGTGTLTASEYQLNGATVNANLGAGNLFQVTGVSTLNGTSASEAVTIAGGTLTLGASDRLSDTATLVVGAGGTLNIGAFNETVGIAGLSGVLDGTGTLTASEYQLNGATVNANLGAGNLLPLNGTSDSEAVASGTGNLFQVSGVSTLNGTSASEAVAIAGGTLTLGASDRLSDTATLVVGADGTLNVGAFNDTVGLFGLSGTLNGTGTLTAGEYQLNGATVNANLGAGDLFQVSGVSTLNGTSGSQQVSIVGGTLTLGASDRLSDTATVTVGSGAVLNLNVFNDTVGLFGLSGTLNGTGTLTAAETQLAGATVNANLAGDRLFNLVGESILNGTAAQNLVSVQGGTLRLGASERLSDAATVSVSAGATLALGAWMERIGSLYGMGDVTIGSTGRLTLSGAESGFGGRLSGAGTLAHTGGLFTLVGDHTIANIVNQAGELRFLGSTTGAVSVTGGTLTGAGTIGGALRVSNGAVLSPGLADQMNGIGGFTVGGLTLTGGRLNIDVTGTAAGNMIDQIRVLGAATLTGGTVAPTFQGPASGFDFSTRYLFIQANSLIGSFSNGSVFTAAAQEGLFWRVRYDLAPNSAVLELRRLTNFDPGTSGTGNHGAVGAAFSVGQLEASDDYAAILSILAGLSDAERNAAFDSVSGEALADMTTSLFSANDHFMQTVQSSGGGGDDNSGSLSFASQLSLTTDRASEASQLAGVLNAYDPGASMTGARGGWVSVFTGDQELEGKKAGQANVDSRHSGFAGGYGVSNGAWSFGGAAGVSRMEGDVVARASSYETDLSHAAGYMRFDDGRWVADVTASVFGGEADTRRIVTVGPFSGAARGDTHAEGQAIAASVARRFRFEDDGTIALGVIGTVSNASVDGFTETGAGALSLTVAGLERDWQTLNISARASQPYRVNGRTMKVYGGMGVLLTTGDRQATGDMRFSGAPTGFGAFTIEGAETPPLAGVTEFGLEVEAADGVSISAGYRGLFSERLSDNQVGMKLNVRW